MFALFRRLDHYNPQVKHQTSVEAKAAFGQMKISVAETTDVKAISFHEITSVRVHSLRNLCGDNESLLFFRVLMVLHIATRPHVLVVSERSTKHI